MRIEPARTLRGTLRLPGDKSISHRAALIASLARGRSRLSGFATSRDCHATLECLRRLGMGVEREAGNVLIENRDVKLRATVPTLDCENSGSTMRMMAGVLAWRDFATTLTGDDSLKQRPMRRIIEPLRQMGAQVEATNDCAPLRITGRTPLLPIRYEMPVASAQVKSCVLLAGLGAEGRTSVVERMETRDHTERLLRFFGGTVDVESLSDAHGDARSISVDGSEARRALACRDLLVPGDISSAAFFIAAATLLPSSELHLEGVGLNPTRTEFLSTLSRLGAHIAFDETGEAGGEPYGRITVRGVEGLAPSGDASASDAVAPVLRGAQVARLIDELPMLAVIATQVERGLVVRDAAELRVKETDRIRATLDNLRRMGAEVEEYADGFAIHGRTQLRGALIDSYSDHRIAMAFTVAALIAVGGSEIQGAECVGISFPEFFELLESVVER